MIGRIVEHQAGGVVVVDRAVPQGGPEHHPLVRAHPPVPVDRGDVAVAREQVGAVRPAVDRGTLSQGAVVGVRVVEERVVEVTQIEALDLLVGVVAHGVEDSVPMGDPFTVGGYLAV